MLIRSLCLFYFSFGLIARASCAGKRASGGGIFWVVGRREVRGKALRWTGKWWDDLRVGGEGAEGESESLWL